MKGSKKVIVQPDIDRVKARIEFVPFGRSGQLKMVLYLKNSSGKELIIKDFELRYQSFIHYNHPWGTFNETIPAQSEEMQIYDYSGVWTDFYGTLFQWEVRMFFEMDGRKHVLITRPGSNGTDHVNKMIADIDLDWDGEYSGEIPQD